MPASKHGGLTCTSTKPTKAKATKAKATKPTKAKATKATKAKPTHSHNKATKIFLFKAKMKWRPYLSGFSDAELRHYGLVPSKWYGS